METFDKPCLVGVRQIAHGFELLHVNLQPALLRKQDGDDKPAVPQGEDRVTLLFAYRTDRDEALDGITRSLELSGNEARAFFRAPCDWRALAHAALHAHHA